MKSFIKTKKPKNRLKTFVITILYILIILLLSLFTLEITGLLNFNTPKATTNTSSESDINYDAPTDEQKQAGEDIKKQNDQPTTNNDLGILITSIIPNGGNIRIRNTISGAITNNGTCVISITNSSTGKNYEATAQTFAMTSYSTCQGFDIPKSELGTGEWQIELSATIDGKTSTSSSNYKVE